MDCDRNSSRWQFSIRGLLVLTAIVSLVLAFAVNLPDVFRIMLIVAAPVLVVAAVLQSANFATSDRRPRLSVLSWSVLGAFFAMYAVALFRLLFQPGVDDDGGLFIGLGLMGGCFLICMYRAYRSYLLIGRSRPASSGLERVMSRTESTEPRKD